MSDYFIPIFTSSGSILRKSGLFLLCWALFALAPAQNQTIKVHFLYGSKPAKGYKKVEKKWFGGLHGGHVGIEYAKDRILNFGPKDRYHILSYRKKKHGKFFNTSSYGFWKMFPTGSDSVKAATVLIPISDAQAHLLDSISRCYIQETPYDYAFLGYRCASATYEILDQLDLVLPKGRWRASLRYFYPQPLRKWFFKFAKQEGWEVIRREGSVRRKWEKD